ncbi:Inherit from COG: Methyltransferase [Seminavis robusta]|uniref:Inherit from COG: Methyltransferase n=1 Tax=Seminavis robusta TaxID=568900 RepID=A0A9N8HGE7_9STRA|nr:Inherit from COG: Methyltransferase [Seminavis robusta]|eukprot:Sro506_g156310.1 Inherit from COG: Methyltransferase (321) ;mRNA; r:25266-26228
MLRQDERFFSTQGISPLPPDALALVKPVDCFEVPPQKPIHLTPMQAKDQGLRKIAYPVSLGWWDRRLESPQFLAREPVESNANVKLVYNLLRDTPGALVDVGANVGFMTNLGLELRRRVYAVEPIQYNVAKICEAYRSPYFDLHREHQLLQLYQAVAGRSFKQELSVTRPATHIGYFDQTSLSRNNVQHPDVEEEFVPMVSLDSILFTSEDEKATALEPIAMVKIDVQGHEYTVLVGMHRLLLQARDVGYPKYVLYASDQQMLRQSGHTSERTIELVESYGYQCMYTTKEQVKVLCVLGGPSREDEKDGIFQFFGPEKGQ